MTPSAPQTFTVRAMSKDDLPAVGQLAAKLVRMHHELDPRRFMDLPNAAVGYARYLGSELPSADVVLVVAARTGSHGVTTEPGPAIVGYAYARLEARSYNDLLEACGKLHDVFVDESARHHGLGERLVLEVIRRLEEKGAPRIVLMTAARNEAAQRLFARLGFGTSMFEMTRESGT